jgi:hypothetical protein
MSPENCGVFQLLKEMTFFRLCCHPDSRQPGGGLKGCSSRHYQLFLYIIEGTSTRLLLIIPLNRYSHGAIIIRAC